MRNALALILILLLPMQILAAYEYGGIKLVDGYRIKNNWAVDAAAWTIYREG